MYKQIMVPLDGSSFSTQALSHALGAACRMDATVHFVRVHKPTGAVLNPATPWLIDLVAEERQRETEKEYLKKVAALPRASGLRIETALLDGQVADALERYVALNGIDLVIMTTHGRGGLSRVWLGSVADTLVRNIDVPVLLLRPTSVEKEYGPDFSLSHIVIPVDGTGSSESVIEQAMQIGGLTNARYTLVQVVAPPVLAGASNGLSGSGDAEFELVRKHARADLEKLAAPMRARGVDVQTSVVVQNQSAAGILECASEAGADLIAMATHGSAGWTRMALGSVADKVLRATQTPLLLMRPDVNAREVTLETLAPALLTA
jgi:nucleotide-binding universal stress UspA family protein